jgi:hypothetical protein
MSLGDKQAIIKQYELPPKLCFKIEVSLHSLYGTCEVSSLDNAAIHLRSTNRDLLI